MKVLKEIRSRSSGKNSSIKYEYKGKRSKIANILRGTYVCKDLLVPIACWISPVFSLKVAQIINHVLIKQSQETLLKNITSLKSEITSLKIQNEKYEKLKDISPKTKNVLKRHIFIITKIKDPYPFYALRCQKKSKAKHKKITTKISKFKGCL